METASGKETIIVLRRLIAYSEKIFQLSKDIVTRVSDRREKPRISTAAVVKSSLVLFWARMGSSNAWEQVGRARFWQRWLGERAYSADTLGRVHALLDANGLRQGIHDVYECLKRNKALPDIYGLGVVVLDGHESHASYLRHCSGCLQRTIHGAGGDRLQFYHRQVTLLLLPGALPGRETVRLLLDHEPQRPGEDEVETALRLLARVIPAYPRAFDLVLADALTPERRFSTFCSRAANTLWWFSKRNGATSIRMWLDYSTMWRLSRVAIDPASATGGIFQTCSPGPRCRPRCAWFVPWRPTRFAGNSTSRTNHKRVTGSGRPRYRLSKFPSIASSIWGTSDGISRIMASTSWPTNGTPIMYSSMIPTPSHAFCWWPSWLTTFFMSFWPAM